VVLRNGGLTEQLLARLAELRTSRARLVTAQDRERRRLERDDAQTKALLNQVTSHAAQALRELARGIYPTLLADMGVAAALDAQARKAPIPVSVEAGGIGRYPQETEAAVYFCAWRPCATPRGTRHPHQRSPVRNNAELRSKSPATARVSTRLPRSRAAAYSAWPTGR
jgi:hypothetical protein